MPLPHQSLLTVAPGASRELSEEVLNHNGIIGHLSQQPGGRLRYVEPTFWAFNKDEAGFSPTESSAPLTNRSLMLSTLS